MFQQPPAVVRCRNCQCSLPTMDHACGNVFQTERIVEVFRAPLQRSVSQIAKTSCSSKLYNLPCTNTMLSCVCSHVLLQWWMYMPWCQPPHPYNSRCYTSPLPAYNSEGFVHTPMPFCSVELLKLKCIADESCTHSDALLQWRVTQLNVFRYYD